MAKKQGHLGKAARKGGLFVLVRRLDCALLLAKALLLVSLNPMSTRLQRFMLRSINIWPPFLAAGIHVRWGEGYRSADVEMRLHFWNRNYVGTHYGGSLYSMTDPFYMLMLMENLGRDYIVWDKAASIRFRRPGKGTVRAQFRLTSEQLDDIRVQLRTQEKYEPVFVVEVKDEAGNLVAEVQKVIHIRHKPLAPAQVSA